MKPCNEPPFDLRLPASAAFTIADAAGVGIECRQGCVWITLDGDTRDFVLEPGQRFQHDGHRHAVVSAFEASPPTTRAENPPNITSTVACSPGLATRRFARVWDRRSAAPERGKPRGAMPGRPWSSTRANGAVRSNPWGRINFT